MITTSLAKYKGARGDNAVDCTAAFQKALRAVASAGGTLLIPPGLWRIKNVQPLVGIRAPISIVGSGASLSQLVFEDCAGPDLEFDQLGYQQPAGLELLNVGLVAQGTCARALRVSFGAPAVTNDHYRPSVILHNVRVESCDSGFWSEGIEIADAWNTTLENVFVSGSPRAGEWSKLSGTGLRLSRMVVNGHFSNVRCNFWQTGVQCHSDGRHNPEGLFFSNCSMVAVHRGVWLAGSPLIALAPRLSTFTWHGGLIECRVGGGPAGAHAAFHLAHVWTALITGAQMVAEMVPDNANLAPNEKPRHTYGIFADHTSGLVVSACDINAWTHGLFATGTARAINSHGNTFTNCATQHIFDAGITSSRSAGHVYFNNPPNDIDLGIGNTIS